VYCLLSGIALVGLGAFISVNPVDTTTSSSNVGAQFIGIISAAVGGVLLAIGIGYIVMFYGLLKGIAIQIVSTSVGSVLVGFHNTNNVVQELQVL
jgi:hypothetical protein